MKKSLQLLYTIYCCNLLQQKFRVDLLLQRSYHCNNLISIILQYCNDDYEVAMNISLQ